MRSAYVLLGLPGNASQEEIEQAWQRSQRLFTRERLAEEEGALERFGELKSAYQVLRDPSSRAAHDRKLLDAGRPAARPRTIVVEREAASPLGRMLVIGAVLMAVLFAAGATLNWRNNQVRKEQAAVQAAELKAAEEEAVRKRAEAERAEARRAAALAQAAQAEANDRRQAHISAVIASSNLQAQEARDASARRQEASQAQRQLANQANEDRRAAAEARIRVERDKQAVRELCMAKYRRPDC